MHIGPPFHDYPIQLFIVYLFILDEAAAVLAKITHFDLLVGVVCPGHGDIPSLPRLKFSSYLHPPPSLTYRSPSVSGVLRIPAFIIDRARIKPPGRHGNISTRSVHTGPGGAFRGTYIDTGAFNRAGLISEPPVGAIDARDGV